MPIRKKKQPTSATQPAENAPHIIIEACPTSIPVALLALADDELVSYQRIGGHQQSLSVMRAKALRDEIEAIVSRQAKGFFTLEEAARVLEESRPSLDPNEVVQRIRLAHSAGKLQIRRGKSRFPLGADEPVTDYWDLVEAIELDAWLRASTKYGFPKAEGADISVSATKGAEAQREASARGRRLKRAVLILENRRRWPTIERDLKDAATNGLSTAARDTAAVGWWWDELAIDWARARGKWSEPASHNLDPNIVSRRQHG